MSNVLRVAIVDPQDASREAVKGLLLGMDMVWLEAECSRYEFFADVVDQTHPDVGVVHLDSDPAKALELIQRVSEAAPDCQVVAISSTTDGQLILKVMRAGAREFLTYPVSAEDMARALERLGGQRLGGEGRSRGSMAIAVVGATGGVGTTSLAVNLGCALAADPRNSAALVDLDLALGDADVYLDAIPEYTLADVAQNISRLDFTLLKRSLTKHSSGLFLLPRPVHLHDIRHIDPDCLHRVIGLLKATFSHLILDLSKSFSEIDMMAMEAAKHVLLVTQLDLGCLRNVVRLLASFERHDGLKEKVRVVVNRVGLNQSQISLKKAEETLGCSIYWQIPNDYRTMSEVRNHGVPLISHAPKAALTQAIVSLARDLAGQQAVPEAETAQRRGWLRFLSRAPGA
ncbi:MAG: pilus assembly protein CpaE [Pirellulaceae bacterium]|nr:MAG: pilus assembly protein CpaE [Pirellulaceae bacterium]